jgi:hypothetical protein
MIGLMLVKKADGNEHCHGCFLHPTGKHWSSPEKLFDWFDSGITENLLMEDAKTFLEQAGGDVKRANDEIMENIEEMIEDLYYNYDFVPEQFFEENITNPLIEDLTKTSD